LQDFNTNDNNLTPKTGFIQNLNPFGYVVIVLLIVFFLYQIIGGFLAIISGGEKLDENIHITRLVLAFGQYMLILAPTVFFTRLQTHDIKGTFRLKLPAPGLLILSILGIVLIQPLLQGYMYFQDFILNHLPILQESIKWLKDIFDMLEKATDKIVSAYSPLEFIVVVFVISITPAICEEILFRGFVLKNIEKVAKPSIAIFLTGFLFALYHFEPFNMIPLIVLGCYLGFVVHYSDSIYTGMICHFFNNFFASYLLYKYGAEELKTPEISGSETLNVMVMILASLILFGIVLMMYYKLRAKQTVENV
jgi:hypothetical protein